MEEQKKMDEPRKLQSENNGQNMNGELVQEEEFSSELTALDAYEGSEPLNNAWEAGTANSDAATNQQQSAQNTVDEVADHITGSRSLTENNLSTMNQRESLEEFAQESFVDDFHWDEEYAAEIATNDRNAVDPAWGEPVESEQENDAQMQWVGWASLAVSIISLFFYPAFLGPVGIVGGIIAFWSGNRALGGWSVAIGLISLAAYFIFLPFYAL